MMFHFFCVQGYALGLDRAAKGMGLAGKLPGMTGALAPRYWAEGRRQRGAGLRAAGRAHHPGPGAGASRQQTRSDLDRQPGQTAAPAPAQWLAHRAPGPGPAAARRFVHAQPLAPPQVHRLAGEHRACQPAAGRAVQPAGPAGRLTHAGARRPDTTYIRRGVLLSQIYVSLDIETTGLRAETDFIIEIGAVKFKLEGQVLDTWSHPGEPPGAHPPQDPAHHRHQAARRGRGAAAARRGPEALCLRARLAHRRPQHPVRPGLPGPQGLRPGQQPAGHLRAGQHRAAQDAQLQPGAAHQGAGDRQPGLSPRPGRRHPHQGPLPGPGRPRPGPGPGDRAGDQPPGRQGGLGPARPLPRGGAPEGPLRPLRVHPPAAPGQGRAGPAGPGLCRRRGAPGAGQAQGPPGRGCPGGHRGRGRPAGKALPRLRAPARADRDAARRGPGLQRRQPPDGGGRHRRRQEPQLPDPRRLLRRPPTAAAW